MQSHTSAESTQQNAAAGHPVLSRLNTAGLGSQSRTSDNHLPTPPPSAKLPMSMPTAAVDMSMADILPPGGLERHQQTHPPMQAILDPGYPTAAQIQAYNQQQHARAQQLLQQQSLQRPSSAHAYPPQPSAHPSTSQGQPHQRRDQVQVQGRRESQSRLPSAAGQFDLPRHVSGHGHNSTSLQQPNQASALPPTRLPMLTSALAQLRYMPSQQPLAGPSNHSRQASSHRPHHNPTPSSETTVGPRPQPLQPPAQPQLQNNGQAQTQVQSFPNWSPTQWDTGAHARGTFRGVREIMEQTMVRAEATLHEELSTIKEHYGAREKNAVRLFNGRIAELYAMIADSHGQRDAALRERDKAQNDRATLLGASLRWKQGFMSLYERAKQMNDECLRLWNDRTRLNAALAKLVVEASERETNGSVNVSLEKERNLLISNLLEQTKQEEQMRKYEEQKRIKAEHDLELMKEYFRKNVSQQSSSAEGSESGSWQELPQAIASILKSPSAGAQAQQPLSSDSERVHAPKIMPVAAGVAGVVTPPNSRLGTADPEGGNNRALSSPLPPAMQDVIDLTLEGSDEERDDNLSRVVADAHEVGKKRERTSSEASIAEMVFSAKRRRIAEDADFSTSADPVAFFSERWASLERDIAKMLGPISWQPPSQVIAERINISTPAPAPAPIVNPFSNVAGRSGQENAEPPLRTQPDAEAEIAERDMVIDLQLEYDDDEGAGEDEERKPDAGQLKQEESDELIKEEEDVKPDVAVASPAADFAPLPNAGKAGKTETAQEAEDNVNMGDDTLLADDQQLSGSSSSSSTIPSPRKQLSISHIDLAYRRTADNMLVCRMCRHVPSRQKLVDTFPVTIYKADASWQEIVSHVESEHPPGFELLVNMTPEEIAEMKLTLD
ncbi:uncharacterized protein FIBRA_07960 [Fibroporia radiculosa]|uniref:Uncharacterized protein n=1 Tax=Fibroporia radiculosa TaxID=599839 RepID=J4GG17_9APHY|nr:uncharacterized protein FIBRA_07960 [Fibroporia radiculosa]CCM05728.1 predicted protein [Fibroporia radiculosa]